MPSSTAQKMRGTVNAAAFRAHAEALARCMQQLLQPERSHTRQDTARTRARAQYIIEIVSCSTTSRIFSTRNIKRAALTSGSRAPVRTAILLDLSHTLVLDAVSSSREEKVYGYNNVMVKPLKRRACRMPSSAAERKCRVTV